jgi:hypothetical protein
VKKRDVKQSEVSYAIKKVLIAQPASVEIFYSTNGVIYIKITNVKHKLLKGGEIEILIDWFNIFERGD